MQTNVETAIQWLRDTVRCHLRAADRGIPGEPGPWVDLCWDIGHSLAMMQSHGIPVPPVIEAVSSQLRKEFPGERGLRPSDFQQMRHFFLTYFERPQWLPRLRAAAWDLHAYILENCKDPVQQEFYLELCLGEGCTLAELARAIRSSRFELSAALSKGAGVPEDANGPGHEGGNRGRT
jgi:hypothetical protein